MTTAHKVKSDVQARAQAYHHLGRPIHGKSERARMPWLEDAATHHPIACESCRNKKSKCSRELPVCFQCDSTGAGCQYPPLNKRGIPAGYLAYIEQRLFETEVVLIELLSAIYNAQSPIQSQRLSEVDHQVLLDINQKQPKSAKIEEWKSSPLTTDEHRREWWLKRFGVLSQPTVSHMESNFQDAPTPQDAWLDASPISAHYDEGPSHTAMQPTQSIPSMPQQSALMAPWQTYADATMPYTGGDLDRITGFVTPASIKASQGASNEPVPTSVEPKGPAVPNHISAERLRKYF
ncbi:hypothetical protein CC86DRAFT_465639 [Ophiobolus disseminans]|uniref:Zn(2)-C6 fungal-type domain-containing protein n=1 Tax=Ophiobolus disseminans TaxID=1469910 RepID=A0A6A7A4X0_9PLEO|nr:hypothetical protein CC86DRAFT_465639 [Ophiobolus disseminans]